MSAAESLFPILTHPLSEAERESAARAGKSRLLAIYKIHVSRLDEQFGPHCWSCTYRQNGNSITCRLDIAYLDGVVIKSGNSFAPKGGFKDSSPSNDPFLIAFIRASQQAGCLRDASFEEFRPEASQQEATEEEEVIQWEMPTAGPLFFPWVRRYARNFQVDAVSIVNQKARENEWPSDVREWDQAMVDRMAKFLIAKAKKLPNYKGEFTH